MNKIISVLCFLILLLSVACDRKEPDNNAVDLRQWAHGINYVALNSEKGLLVWSEAAEPVLVGDDAWTHDVYYSYVNNPQPTIEKRLLIHATEAQEPASVSMSGDGKIIVTFEDGNDAGDYLLAQRYAIYDTNLNIVRPYPQTVAMGGHSGHVASTSEHHVVFWCDGWVKGGGVDNLGSGDDVLATILTSNGDILRTVDVAVGNNFRDWWPLLSASDDDSVLLVWQRFVSNKTYSRICVASLSVQNGNLGLHTILDDLQAEYYTYFVTYLPNSDCFAVGITTVDNKGVLILFDKQGREITRKMGLQPFLREQNPAITTSEGVEYMACATKAGVCFIKITPSYNITSQILSNNDSWSYCGTALFWLDDVRFAVVNIGKNRILKIVNIN